MKRITSLLFKKGVKQDTLSKGGAGVEGSPTARTIDEYDAQVLKRLDRSLHLNTFTFPIPQGYYRHNFKYMTRASFLPTSRTHQYDEHLRQKHEMSKKGLTIPVRGMQELRPIPREATELLRTTIDPIVSAKTQLPSFGHLSSMSDSSEFMQQILEKERNYLDFRMKQRQIHSRRVLKEWAEQFRSVRNHWMRVTNNWVISVPKEGDFRILGSDYSNLRTLLDRGVEGADPHPLIDADEIGQYFLNFRDDFSYGVLRHSRFIKIQEKNIERIFLSADESLLGIQVRFKQQTVALTLFKDLATGRWADFYFAEEFSMIDFFQNEQGTQLVYCLAHEHEVKAIPLTSQDFIPLQPFTKIGKFFIDHINANYDRLKINTVDSRKAAAKSLVSVAMGSYLGCSKFGRHNFLQVNLSDSSVPLFYYLTHDSAVQVPVNSSE